MHLCIDARMLYASGIGTYLQNLLPALIHTHHVTLIGDEKEINSYNTHIIHTSIPIYSIADILRFPKLIPTCDIFWTPHYNIPLLPIPARKRVVTIHDVFHLAFLHTLSLKQKVYAQLLLNAAVRMSDQIITVSDFSKAEIIKYTRANPEKIYKIYNGVDHERFHPVQNQSTIEMVKQKYQLPDKFLLFVGNVKPHKNLISLVKAFAQIKEELPDHYLVIVGKREGFITGDRELFEFLQQDNDLNRRVTFTGFVADKDLPVLYTIADLFVFPSLYEGFGLPPLEAMACSCPVLVSDRASMPEICGDAAWYVNPQDVAHISRQLKQALSLPAVERQKWIEKGMDKSKHFTWRSSVAQHMELLGKLF